MAVGIIVGEGDGLLVGGLVGVTVGVGVGVGVEVGSGVGLAVGVGDVVGVGVVEGVGVGQMVGTGDWVGVGDGVGVDVGIGVEEGVGHGLLGMGVGVLQADSRVKDVAFELAETVIEDELEINEIARMLIKMHTHENINAIFRLDPCIAVIDSPFRF